MPRVHITDVYLRDGLQDEKCIVPTDDKLAVLDAIVESGILTAEIASFVSATRVPQMADAEEIISRAPRRDGIRYSALTLNSRGVHRAAETEIDVIQIVTSASEGHSRANAGRSPDDALRDLSSAVAQHPGRRFIGGVSTAFVCPFDGVITPARLVEVCERMADTGVSILGLADTLGIATTDQVLSGVDAVRTALPELTISLHLHNAHDQALETAVRAALDLGIEYFDSAVAGYGGCPFAPGAHGNLATEELVDTFHRAGIDTGIDTSALANAAALARAVVDRALPLPTPASAL
ncbi:hydroxymethylglutaryl-CoA lyase [Rhodococcus fascians]|nr:hydroxymethylglutaryl-CoA lyase [Rhodococcus fascians]MBY4237481.1 hydroxymethylglutaryl-CoA lyase [Rhodococcus fascians]MBY4253160.1 hydroxymethylglutaryl-CoA lyase [Rhodococcus fascians]MBY4268600.1 hydroxymethylglutaryl-CoA lyase [Rhodococcus fascians]